MSVRDLAVAYGSAADALEDAQATENRTKAALKLAQADVAADETAGPSVPAVPDNLVKWAKEVADHRRTLASAQSEHDAAVADLDTKTSARDAAWAALVGAS